MKERSLREALNSLFENYGKRASRLQDIVVLPSSWYQALKQIAERRSTTVEDIYNRMQTDASVFGEFVRSVRP